MNPRIHVADEFHRLQLKINLINDLSNKISAKKAYIDHEYREVSY